MYCRCAVVCISRIAMCLAIATLSAASAWAAPLYVETTYDGHGFIYYGTNNGATSGGTRAEIWGGERLEKVSTSPSINPFEVWGLFCFEPYVDLPFEEVLTYQLGTLADFGLNAIQQNRLHVLADNAYPIFINQTHPYAYNVGAAAFQVAVWEIIHDGATAAPLNLTADITRVNVQPSDSNAIKNMFMLANSWIGEMNAGNWTTTGQYEWQLLISDQYQDLGLIVEVPEPSSMILAGMALLGVVALGRRRARS